MNTETEQKTVIGYKSPMDLFHGEIPEGSVYIAQEEGSSFYEPESRDAQSYWMPKEIVETWEPVYEEDEKSPLAITLPSNNGGINVDVNGEIRYGGSVVNPAEVKAVIAAAKEVSTKSILGFGVGVETINIGIHSGVSLSELENALRQAEEHMGK